MGDDCDVKLSKAERREQRDIQVTDNLLRLSFSTHQEFLDYVGANRQFLTDVWHLHETLGNQEARLEFQGICDLCDRRTTYSITPYPTPNGIFKYQANWWAALVCGCGQNTTSRASFRAFLDAGFQPTDRIYHVGQYSPFANMIRERAPGVTTSQYDANRKNGEVVDGVRYEDLTSLTFGTGEFDCVIALDILEHIPDYRAALREIARVLRPGGRAVTTFPWLGGNHYQTLTRAELRPDGTINHILPPEYHGDPAAPTEGILSFRSFGWQILDEFREIGFSDAAAKFVFGPVHGHMSLLCPVIVGVR